MGTGPSWACLFGGPMGVFVFQLSIPMHSGAPGSPILSRWRCSARGQVTNWWEAYHLPTRRRPDCACPAKDERPPQMSVAHSAKRRLARARTGPVARRRTHSCATGRRFWWKPRTAITHAVAAITELITGLRYQGYFADGHRPVGDRSGPASEPGEHRWPGGRLGGPRRQRQHLRLRRPPRALERHLASETAHSPGLHCHARPGCGVSRARVPRE